MVDYVGLDFNQHAKVFSDVINALVRTGFQIVLIPHVVAEKGVGRDDRRTCDRIYRNCPKKSAVFYANVDFNAAELKYLIGLCDVFVGERTHATIAALSSFIPTLSISYSVKSHGINRDLFGHENYVVAARTMTADQLWLHIQELLNDRERIRETLRREIPAVQQRARENVECFREVCNAAGILSAPHA
jgi:polysaccharide pyruvyl transferase WcaK-like protein